MHKTFFFRSVTSNGASGGAISFGEAGPSVSHADVALLEGVEKTAETEASIAQV